ncbi:MAG: ribonuclease domain-containing protein [Pseudomonadota bacterium]|nr:ribonuclease domain-containing protein [Pseudomonadota bacterium]MDP1903912.1 ribonuclease domain-containing protein [Pseudomonadota bacterium]MDP2351151.1 ribonuclease domain-containing protein [Pseudomonadota bacterium]
MNRLRLFLLFLIVLLPFATQAYWFGDNSRAAAEITVAQLPAEGRATLALIKRGGPFPYAKDGTTFGNREDLLPQQPRGHYKEYTVPTPGLNHRGARRIVAGGGNYWYTADHYRSFRRIKE